MADVCLTKMRRQRLTRHLRRPARHRDMAPTQGHVTAIRRSIVTTAATFGQWLSAECIEDLVQEVFLGLWKSRAEHLLDCLPYLRRVASNVTLDLLRRQNAQKRKTRPGLKRDLELLFWPPSRTPEEVLIEREEALRLIAADRGLKRRVRYAMKQYARAQSRTGV